MSAECYPQPGRVGSGRVADIFISYKREERARCERIAAKLKALDLDVWFDARLTTGESFDREIEQTIKKAKAVLVLWSPASTESRWVRNEAGIGEERGVLAAVQLSPCELPIQFRSTHYEVLHDPDFPDDHPSWLKVLDRLGELTRRPGLAGYSRALGRAGEPLLAWARANPDDPLARKAEALAERLAVGEEENAPVIVRKGAGVGALLGAAALALGMGALGAWALKPAPAAPPPTARELAFGMVGRWNEVGLGDCEAGALTLSIEPSGVALGDAEVRVGRQIVGLDGGWVRLGDGSLLRLAGENLERKARPEAQAQVFTPCR